MTKFLRSAALMAMLAGGAAGVLTVTNDTAAQEKVAPKKGVAVKAGKFVISEGKDMMFRFSVYDAEGKFLANSGANKFATKEEATKGVETFKAALKDAKVESKDDEK